MTAQKKQTQIDTVKYFIECVIGHGDLTSYDQMITDDAIGHCPDSWKFIHPIDVRGRENTRKYDEEYARAFQSISITIKEIIPFENKIFAQWSCKKIHRETFYGIPANGCQFSLSGLCPCESEEVLWLALLLHLVADWICNNNVIYRANL